MDEPEVTVLLATRNRAAHLSGCLATIQQAVTSTKIPTEVLVVDNGSSDATLDVLRAFSQKIDGLRFVQDGLPGKSGAINRALKMARGSVIVFTDDDVHVPSSWIDDMATPIIEGQADAVCGRLVLAPHLDRPWLTTFLRSLLAELLDVTGEAPGMVGANMASSKQAALDIQFEEGLGPGARGFDDDVLFNYCLKGKGYRLTGSTGPHAEHHLSSDRLTYSAMVNLARQSGLSHAYLEHLMAGAKGKWLPLKEVYLMIYLLAYRLAHRARPDSIQESEFRIIQRLYFVKELRRLKRAR